jgi:hypothetical protein
VALTHEEFNDAVGAFVADVERAVNCFPAQLWTIEADLASPDSDRLRSVVNAEVDLRGPHDASDKGLAELAANYKLCVDSCGAHLAVEHSSFVLKAKLDRAPIIRWDYDRDARSKPASHVQVTAHRGALSHLLSRLDHRTPHSIESLHIPMGGERFRPCLEDIVEFLIRDCGFPGTDGWAAALADGRAKWRRIQTRAVVRDSPAEAVAALIAMGYTVSPPAGGDEPQERLDKLTAW